MDAKREPATVAGLDRASSPAVELDCRGLNCPLPILRTKKAIVALSPGDFLRVLATDPGAVADMAAFSRRTGHALVDQGQADGAFFFLFRVA